MLKDYVANDPNKAWVALAHTGLNMQARDRPIMLKEVLIILFFNSPSFIQLFLLLFHLHVTKYDQKNDEWQT